LPNPLIITIDQDNLRNQAVSRIVDIRKQGVVNLISSSVLSRLGGARAARTQVGRYVGEMGEMQTAHAIERGFSPGLDWSDSDWTNKRDIGGQWNKR
jgi:hypothetical protein